MGLTDCRARDITFAIPLQSLYMSNHRMGGHSARAHDPVFVRKPVTRTLMFKEAAQSGSVVAAQAMRSKDMLALFAASIAGSPPSIYLTCARGSSDHAATFMRYLLEIEAGVVTSSFSPSVFSVYGRAPAIGSGVCVVISQSGRSPDLLAVAQQYRDQGSRVLAIVNDLESPLAQIADFVFPIGAGPEASVAATKSFIGTLSAILQIVACHPGTAVNPQDILELPNLLDLAWEQDWSALTKAISASRGLFVIGRGLGFAAASEAALKMKETSGLHAEAFSAAEVRHGPMALLATGMPVLIFRQNDKAARSLDEFASFAAAQGNQVFVVGAEVAGTTCLPCPAAASFLEPIVQIQAFYRAANELSVARGRNPDAPPMLRKVTQTL